jgi:hypothetical protein
VPREYVDVERDSEGWLEGMRVSYVRRLGRVPRSESEVRSRCTDCQLPSSYHRSRLID